MKAAKRAKISASGHSATPAARAAKSAPAWLPPFLLALLACGVYANTLANGFVSDDATQLLANPLLKDAHHITEIFFNNAWARPDTASNYYRPLQMLVYLCVGQVFGFNAAAFHALMVLLHAANTVLVLLIGRRLLQSERAACAAAALFAVHPIHGEAVAWVAVLPDLLLTFLALLMFYRLFHVRGRGWVAGESKARALDVAGQAALFLLALLTKEPAVMLLPLLASAEWLTALLIEKYSWRDRLVVYGSLLAMLGVYFALRVKGLGGLAPGQKNPFHLRGADLAFSATIILAQYLGKLILPLHLSYYHAFTPTRGITPTFLLSALVIAALLAAVILLRRRTALNAPPGVVSFSLLWILLPLLPTLNLAGLGEVVFSERYLYLPSVGFAWIAGLGWNWLAQRQRGLAYAAGGVIVALASYQVIARNTDWHDNLRLFTVTSEQWPHSASMARALAVAYEEKTDYTHALAECQRAVQLAPNEAETHNDLGDVYTMIGKKQEAIAEYRQAVALNPSLAEGFLNLGVALKSTGQTEAAVAAEETAMQLRPQYPEALNALGLMRRDAKDYPGAVALLQRAIAANPAYTEAYFNLGVVYSDMERYHDGAGMFLKALDSGSHPSYEYLAHYGLGVCYTRMNLLPNAAQEFGKSLELQPSFDRAQRSLDAVRAAMSGSGSTLSGQPR